MKSIHNKSFLDVWHGLYLDSRPGPTADHWQIDGVDWIVETYRTTTRDISFHIETHVLTHGRQSGPSWRLLVVVERWWNPDSVDALRSTVWRHTLQGRDKSVLDWFKRQRDRLEAELPPRSFA